MDKSRAWLPSPFRAVLSTPTPPDNRTALYGLITEAGLTAVDARMSKEVIDCCYNTAMASSLGAANVMLSSHVPQPVETLCLAALGPGDTPSRLAVKPLIGYDVPNSSEMMGVLGRISWVSLRDFLEQHEQQKPSDKDLSRAAGFLASCRVQNGRIYSLGARLVGAGAGGLVWGLPVFLDNLVFGNTQTTAGIAAIVGAALASALPGAWSGDAPISGFVRGLFKAPIERRFYGILAQRLP